MGTGTGTGTGAWKFGYGAEARERGERGLMGLWLIELLEKRIGFCFIDVDFNGAAQSAPFAFANSGSIQRRNGATPMMIRSRRGPPITVIHAVTLPAAYCNMCSTNNISLASNRSSMHMISGQE